MTVSPTVRAGGPLRDPQQPRRFHLQRRSERCRHHRINEAYRNRPPGGLGVVVGGGVALADRHSAQTTGKRLRLQDGVEGLTGINAGVAFVRWGVDRRGTACAGRVILQLVPSIQSQRYYIPATPAFGDYGNDGEKVNGMRGSGGGRSI